LYRTKNSSEADRMSQTGKRETADEVLQETRRVKEALAKSMDFDIGRIVADARQRQEQSGRKVLSPPSRKNA
jgi:predicted GNAT family N-acyltransferase